MAEIILQSASYQVTDSNASVNANGEMVVLANNKIQSLRLNVSDEKSKIGSVHYAEYDGNSSYNYVVNDEAKKAELMALADQVIESAKAQILNL